MIMQKMLGYCIGLCGLFLLCSCINMKQDTVVNSNQKEKKSMSRSWKAAEQLVIPFYPDLQNERDFQAVAAFVKPSLLFGSGSKHSQAETEIRIAMDSQNLYIAAACFEPLTVDTGKVRTSPWKSDNIEIFLANLERPVWYRQFVVGVNGRRFSDMVHENSWSAKTLVEKNKWCTKLTIPLKVLGRMSGQKLCMNILRQRRNAKELISWAKMDMRALEPYNFKKISVAAAPDMILQEPWTFMVKTNSAGVAWESKMPSDTVLYFRKKGTKKFTEVKRQESTELHSLILNDLQPNTEYEYCVSGGSKVYSLKTLSAKKSDFSFALTMDFHGRSTQLTKILKQANVKKCDLLFLMGDQLNASIARDVHYDGYLNAIQKYWQKPFYCLYGNHDARGQAASAHFDLFAGKEEKGYDAFMHKGVFFVLLDADRDVAASAEYMQKQAEFLKKTVRSDTFKNADFRILLLHVPVTFKYGRWGNENIKLIEHLTKAEQKMFDVALSAHIHEYCATSPVNKTVISADADLNGKTPVRLQSFPEITGPELGLILVRKNSTQMQIRVFDKTDKLIATHIIPLKNRTTLKNKLK